MRKLCGFLLRNLAMSLPVSIALTLSACDDAKPSAAPPAPIPVAAPAPAPASTVSRNSIDGTGETASFNQPNGIATDGSNLYVADTANDRIRKVVIATGEVTTLAGSEREGSQDGSGADALFSQPFGIAVDGRNLYVADSGNNLIRKIVIATREVTTLAGSGEPGASDATAKAALFKGPMGIATDGSNLYVADYYNNKVRKIVIASGKVTTLAGSGSEGAADGTGTAASFNHPIGITTDGENLYVTDYANHKIRKIVIASGVVTTLAGSGTAGSADGTGTAASFNNPGHLAADATNLYVADTYNQKIRKVVIATGEVSTLAGSGTAGGIDALGKVARFNGPFGIATDGSNLYVSDTESNTIRKIVVATGMVSTLAGKSAYVEHEAEAVSKSEPQ